MSIEVILAYFPKITHKRYQELLAAFSDLDARWKKLNYADVKRTGWDDNLVHEFLLWKQEVNEGKILETLAVQGMTAIPFGAPEYPVLLKEIYDPPLCLFVRGSLTRLSHPVAVIGSRKHSAYGKQVAELLIAELARAGVSIVSGLALGIDGIAHSAALTAAGHTVAVLGSGVDRQHVYPRAHVTLSEHILQSGGALVSEYPPGTLPNAYSFPRRNRIIAGISLATLIVEASDTSGALITAHCALEYGREVLCVPQNITSSTAAGVNKLIQHGAGLVTSAQDILDILDLAPITKKRHCAGVTPENPTEAVILTHLGREPIHVDELVKRTELPSATLMSQLTLMEMKGKVRNLGAMMYVMNL